jgi:large subunit ribosomal protein L25
VVPAQQALGSLAVGGVPWYPLRLVRATGAQHDGDDPQGAHDMDQVTIEAQPRTAFGKKVGALRRSGITPIHVYGKDFESQSLQADTHDLIRALAQVGFTTPLTVTAGAAEHFVMVREIQRHPVTERLLHVDLMAVSRTERRQASVPLHFEGESPAAREEGAQVFEDLHALEVEALPTEIPSALVVDLALLVESDSVIHASDLELPANVTLVTDPGAPVARIVHRRAAEQDEEATVEAARGMVSDEAVVPTPAAEPETEAKTEGGEGT